MFAKRLEIARRLLTHERYEDIQRDLNVTPNTITRMSNLLTEKGDGLRKAHQKLEKLEEKYLAKNKEYTKNLENPFRQKLHQKTVLGQVLKAGAITLDKAITKKIKQRTARKELTV
jgi:uncharacterized protein YerC